MRLDLLFVVVAAITSFFGTAAAQVVDPAPFDALLRAHVRDGVVDYPAFAESAAFDRYVESLAAPARLTTPSQRLAHAIDAYNAFAIAGIVKGMSPSSFLGRARYFRWAQWSFDGRSISLYDLENQVIRPLGEPRIHFALVCASQSCPKLRSEAYDASRLDAQLDDQARAFINDPTRNRFDAASRTAHLSPIFQWFEDDFKGSAGSVQRYIARYANDATVAKLLEQDAFRLQWNDYDWSLNGLPLRTARSWLHVATVGPPDPAAS